MKYLKKFNESNEFWKNRLMNPDYIDQICSKYNIKNYTINSDGTVDVDGNIHLNPHNIQSSRLTHFPLKFGKITGNFDCSYNRFESLKGGPREVGGDFHCEKNQLKSLEGAPTSIGGIFDCSYNQLTSLEGSPKIINGSFNCDNNQLKSLEGGPIEVNGGFFCDYNQLTSLKYSPKIINGNFNCNNNQLRNFNGIKNIGGFVCMGNPIGVIWGLFKDIKFLDKVTYIYTDLILSDGISIQGDIMEQIAEELGKELPNDWIQVVETGGYQVI